MTFSPAGILWGLSLDLVSHIELQFNSTVICVGIYKLVSGLINWMYESDMQEISQG